MRQETSQEQALHNLLSPGIGAISQVTFGYQDNLRIIQSHLQEFYGERADWSQCVEAYFRSKEYLGFCHHAKRCEDIPIITVDQLFTMIREDENYQENVKNFLKLNQTIKDAGIRANADDISRAAAMLGISPDQKTAGLFRWLISREKLSGGEKQNIRARITENVKLFTLIIDLFSTLFVPGMQLTFPHIGTAMTQQKSKYFYRGENSFYGSSKPGMFRAANRTSPIQRLANLLVLNEACFFLDQFDAVQKWSPSSVNHLALTQHYGMKTPLMDITSDLKTALFFACCKYENHKWRPMNKKDFAYEQDGAKKKDSRYGVLYRSPTEITDMQWTSTKDETEISLIAPIGYQPFMRCSAQHGYTLFVKDDAYDLLEDPLFDKFRIEHDEDFCRWIFDEMDQGAKVYPHDDIPKIEEYMETIRNTHTISQRTFENLIKTRHYSEQETCAIKQLLQQEGYVILSGQSEYIHNNRLRKINRNYSIDVAYSKVDIPFVSRPMIILPSDTIVESDGNGGWVFVAEQGGAARPDNSIQKTW